MVYSQLVERDGGRGENHAKRSGIQEGRGHKTWDLVVAADRRPSSRDGLAGCSGAGWLRRPLMDCRSRKAVMLPGDDIASLTRWVESRTRQQPVMRVRLRHYMYLYKMKFPNRLATKYSWGRATKDKKTVVEGCLCQGGLCLPYKVQYLINTRSPCKNLNIKTWPGRHCKSMRDFCLLVIPVPAPGTMPN